MYYKDDRLDGYTFGPEPDEEDYDDDEGIG